MLHKNVTNFFSKLKNTFGNSVDDSPKQLLTINFKGFNVLYTEGTSLIERIKKTGDYEPEVTACIIHEVASVEAPVIIDIGANIGLISLSLLAQKNKATIFAFEPGPNQLEMLRMTVDKNALQKKIILSDIALSNKKGKAKFRIHAAADASGDGFLDTERAGPTKSIHVNTDTLDNWWLEMKQPSIDFIKMDTEGSEFYILQGAKKLIKTLKPKMLIEINLKNIKNYPFTSDDLFKLIEEMQYDVFSLKNEPINNINRQKYLQMDDTFLLVPKKNIS